MGWVVAAAAHLLLVQTIQPLLEPVATVQPRQFLEAALLTLEVVAAVRIAAHHQLLEHLAAQAAAAKVETALAVKQPELLAQ